MARHRHPLRQDRQGLPRRTHPRRSPHLDPINPVSQHALGQGADGAALVRRHAQGGRADCHIAPERARLEPRVIGMSPPKLFVSTVGSRSGAAQAQGAATELPRKWVHPHRLAQAHSKVHVSDRYRIKVEPRTRQEVHERAMFVVLPAVEAEVLVEHDHR